jgi:hypothetical protein
MKHVKHWLMFCLVALASACGDPELGEQELGSVEQPMTADGTPTLSYGSNTSIARTSCRRSGVTGQVCMIPDRKGFRWCAHKVSGTSAEHTALQNAFQTAIGSAGVGFTWTHTGSNGAACENAFTAGSADVIIREQSSGLCSGTTGNNIEPYACVAFRPGVTVTESLDGTYQYYTGGSISLDTSDIATKAAGLLASPASLRHNGLVHSKLIMEGLGSQTANNTLYSRRAVAPLNTTLFVSASESCRAVQYEVASGINSFSLDTVNGCPD